MTRPTWLTYAKQAGYLLSAAALYYLLRRCPAFLLP